MAGVLLTQGKQIELEAFVNKTAPQNLVLKLFSNNVTPAAGDTEATYTEATFTGYAAITLAGASWSGSGGQVSFALQTFTSTLEQAVQQIYGWFLVQATSGKAVAAERFSDAPYPIAHNLDKINVTPSFV